jgi:ppGpp synthetase/RelA/SpoT-type nucleotidyltranferase
VKIRTIEDKLREEYFELLPEMTRVADLLKTQIQYSILPITRELKNHETLVVKSRVKECNSAIDALRRRSGDNGAVFDPDQPEIYTLLTLRDLVGVRVLAFPASRALQVDSVLRSKFDDWTPDHVIDKETGQRLALKYYAPYVESKILLQCEYQIVSTLIGLFWEVEHAAIYKPTPRFKGLAPVMQEQTSAVNSALKAFEDEFERQIQTWESSGSRT